MGREKKTKILSAADIDAKKPARSECVSVCVCEFVCVCFCVASTPLSLYVYTYILSPLSLSLSLSLSLCEFVFVCVCECVRESLCEGVSECVSWEGGRKKDLFSGRHGVDKGCLDRGSLGRGQRVQ
jgi:hypothetical protein